MSAHKLRMQPSSLGYAQVGTFSELDTVCGARLGAPIDSQVPHLRLKVDVLGLLVLDLVVSEHTPSSLVSSSESLFLGCSGTLNSNWNSALGL